MATFKKAEIVIPLLRGRIFNGKSHFVNFTVPAEALNNLAIHHSLDSKGQPTGRDWTVTAIANGQALFSGSSKRRLIKAMEACDPLLNDMPANTSSPEYVAWAKRNGPELRRLMALHLGLGGER